MSQRTREKPCSSMNYCRLNNFGLRTERIFNKYVSLNKNLYEL
jgi:hypothetical protein